MAFTPSTECTTPGCRNLVPYGSKQRKCTSCRKQKVDRPNAGNRGYQKGWADSFLDFYPLCHHRIKAVCTLYAAVPDHYPRSRKQLLADGVPEEEVNDWQYLTPSCDACHHKKTTERQPGGWNTPGWSR